MTGTKSNVALLVRDEDGLRNCDEVCLRIDSDTHVEVATTRVFIVGHQFILSDLKKIGSFFWFEVEILYFKIR